MKIILNSKEINTNAKDINSLKIEQGLNGEVVIINGFAIGENVLLKENMQIFIIKKGEIPNKDELKSLILSRNSPKLNDALQNACVGIAGLGGLGSNIAISLARVGVARLVVADFDIVEPSNLNRQQYFTKHIGMPKTDAIKEIISNINPFVEVICHNEKITKDNAYKIFEKCTIICEAFDNVSSKKMMLDEVNKSLKDKVLISSSGMAGYFDSNKIQTIKFAKNVYVCGDLINEANFNIGLMAPRVGICANHQANLVLRILTNEINS